MKKLLQGDQLIWQDRKRILGLPISFTRYAVTESALIKQKGFFTTSTDELQLYRVLDINLKRTLAQKIFGVGTVTIFSGDKSHARLELLNIRKSHLVWKLLGQLVEAERERKRVTSKEMMTSLYQNSDILLDADGDGIPDILQR